MERNGIADYFEKLWSTDDFGLNKAGTELFYKLAERIGCDTQDIAFYDDNVTAIKNCRKSGMEAVAVYDPSNDAYIDEIKASCDIFVDNYFELL